MNSISSFSSLSINKTTVYIPNVIKVARNNDNKIFKFIMKGFKVNIKAPEIHAAIIGLKSFLLKKLILKIYWTWITLIIPIPTKEIKVDNAAPFGPSFGIKNIFKTKFMIKAELVFISTSLVWPVILNVGAAAPKTAWKKVAIINIVKIEDEAIYLVPNSDIKFSGNIRKIIVIGRLLNINHLVTIL